MKRHWNANAGTHFPLSELSSKIFTAADGRLDRHGPVPYHTDKYIALLGKLPFLGDCMIVFLFFFSQQHSPFRTPSADLTGPSWAYEPEVTAMAFLLNTTIACFSCNPGILELANADYWAFTLPNLE